MLPFKLDQFDKNQVEKPGAPVNSCNHLIGRLADKFIKGVARGLLQGRDNFVVGVVRQEYFPE